MAKGVDARSERQELVTRFFFYSDRYHDFRHDVRRFLDIAMDKLNKTASESDISRMRDEFIRTMKFISANFPSAFYRPDGGRRVPRVRLDRKSVVEGKRVAGRGVLGGRRISKKTNKRM